MRVLDLFSGAGGGILGGVLLGWRCVGAVEIDKYCCQVLRQRQLDGCLEEFPIWNMDIREFNTRVAPSYRGMVDLVAAGFPCQPFSVAGKRRGADDERNMWPATIECIRKVRPRYAFLENVPGLLSTPYWGTILGQLAETGYDARWLVLGADDCGANHRRKRLWVLADTRESGAGLEEYRGGRCKWRRADASQPEILRQKDRATRAEGADAGGEDVADAPISRCDAGESETRWQIWDKAWCQESERRGCDVPDSDRPKQGRRDEQEWGQAGRDTKPSGDGEKRPMAESISTRLEVEQCQQRDDGAEQPAIERNCDRRGWWTTEPDVGRVVNELAPFLDGTGASKQGDI